MLRASKLVSPFIAHCWTSLGEQVEHDMLPGTSRPEIFPRESSYAMDSRHGGRGSDGKGKRQGRRGAAGDGGGNARGTYT